MVVDILIHFSIGILVAIIGALPFGLVNMTVVEITLKRQDNSALKLAHGAAIVEVLFGLLALLCGLALKDMMDGIPMVNYFVIAVLVIAGIYFIVKKQGEFTTRNHIYSGFLKGVFLNIISIQVLLFWLVAVTILASRQLIGYGIEAIIPFLTGVWIGKMLVLYIYMLLSNKVIKRSRVISGNINRIIGLVLFVTAVIQIIRI